MHDQLNPNVDRYLSEGCGRCPYGGTPQCKVNRWPEELILLRSIVLDCGLTEELKWGVPCYTYNNSNILIISAFKEYCALSFFKGALLKDTHSILSKPGENSQSARLIRFTSVQKIAETASLLKAYIFEAVDVEKAGLKVNFKKNSGISLPEEFQNKLDEDPALKNAFYALTPGRQRGYILYFSAAKQPRTRESRIERCVEQIFSGKGLNER